VELIKIWCKYNTTYVPGNITHTNVTEFGGKNITTTWVEEGLVKKKVGIEKCEY
jgi:hypothetical protein